MWMKRHGNRWTINECLQLQREFELLEMSVGEIAEKHNRTPNAIMLKLHREGIANYNQLYLQFKKEEMETETEEEEDEEELAY